MLLFGKKETQTKQFKSSNKLSSHKCDTKKSPQMSTPGRLELGIMSYFYLANGTNDSLLKDFQDILFSVVELINQVLYLY